MFDEITEKLFSNDTNNNGNDDDDIQIINILHHPLSLTTATGKDNAHRIKSHAKVSPWQ